MFSDALLEALQRANVLETTLCHLHFILNQIIDLQAYWLRKVLEGKQRAWVLMSLKQRQKDTKVEISLVGRYQGFLTVTFQWNGQLV